MKTQFKLLAGLILGFTAATASAVDIPYPNVGTIAPANTFSAASSGDISAYFFGSDASYTSRIGLKVNGVDTGVYGLNNHTSAYGDVISFGNVNQADTLEFVLQVLDINNNWYSVPMNNADGLNHTYSASFSGDTTIDAGTYIAFEDLWYLGDIDYNDHQFVFTNVVVPEPAGLALLGLGLVALGAARRRAAK